MRLKIVGTKSCNVQSCPDLCQRYHFPNEQLSGSLNPYPNDRSGSIAAGRGNRLSALTINVQDHGIGLTMDPNETPNIR